MLDELQPEAEEPVVGERVAVIAIAAEKSSKIPPNSLPLMTLRVTMRCSLNENDMPVNSLATASTRSTTTWSELLIDTPMALASNVIRSTCAPAGLQQVDTLAEAGDPATGDADVVVAAVVVDPHARTGAVDDVTVEVDGDPGCADDEAGTQGS